jgi:hypothetical protein
LNIRWLNRVIWGLSITDYIKWLDWIVGILLDVVSKRWGGWMDGRIMTIFVDDFCFFWEGF